jgi:acyl-[acyl-carrier-protein]-phospholipid O-acyltransferase/long-chain-fatty-acid--[acyl-carrier-protein] ligase
MDLSAFRATCSAPCDSERGFWALMATQLQGVFSDNAYKTLVVMTVMQLVINEETSNRLIFFINLFFSVPFLLFSMAGGFLADRYSKRSVTVWTKVFEIGVMLLATVALLFHHLPLMLACVFLASTQAALFSPTKYGLLPELLPPMRLAWANGVLELTTFLAIIFGIVTGGYFAKWFAEAPALSALILVVLALAGLSASLRVTTVPAANPAKRLRWNLLSDLVEQVRLIRRDEVLTLAVIGNTYFWFLAELFRNNVLFYSVRVLGTAPQNPERTSYLFASLAIGIGAGSFAAGYLSKNKIENGLIPMGAIGLTIFSAWLFRPGLNFAEVAALLALLGFFGGFYIVPINALIQHRPDARCKGGVIGAANLLSFLGIFGAGGVYYLLQTVGGYSPPAIFLLGAILTLLSSLYAVWRLPEAPVRMALVLITNTIYRIRVEGRENIPEKGGALFVANHMSFVDGLLLAASTDRPIRFLMFKGTYDHPLIKPFALVSRSIPITSMLRPRDLIQSLRTASEAIQNGEVVCIFAEGQITRIGQLLPFRRSFERIMKGVDAPIIPVHLDGVWGSIFSFEQGRFLWKMPRAIPYPTTISFGKPMPPSATAVEVRQAVQELHTEAYRHRRRRMKTLGRAFLRAARWHPFRFFAADPRVPRLCFFSALTKALFLAERLRPAWKNQEMVGILLPPTVPGALVNLAAVLSGKIPVNLNYTASDEVIASCAQQCNLETVVTSQAFLEKVKVRVPGRILLLETLAADPRPLEKLVALWRSLFLPAPVLERALGVSRPAQLDDLATIIFSSGSTGDPKGVMLTHYNVMSNIEQMGQTFSLRPSDRILGILPFFHSFGFTVTIWLPAAYGVGAVYYPNPLDAQAIGELVRRHAVTFMVATPTFLQAYIRRCQPEDFGSLQYVIVGAEKLSDRLATAFEERFGIKPLEGYGCTECAPVVAVNTKDYRAPGFRQVGGKRGKIGHPLPGVSVRIVDPETFQPLPLGTPGLLLVRGPNVMKGYLGKPAKTAEVLRDGWYVTGDIAALDEDGFISITDRLTRISKIGGEMIPHLKVEEKLHEIAGLTEQAFLVTAVPDARKGERLVVLHTLPEEKAREIAEALSRSDLPNLWIPRPNQFFRVEKLPYLGSGKLDLRRARELALNFSGAP